MPHLWGDGQGPGRQAIILPAEVNKFFNKKAWGGAKVGQIFLDGAKAYEVGQGSDSKWVVIERPGGAIQSGLSNKNIADQLATAYREDTGLPAWTL
ncbi:MAG: hypothetical protein LC660_06210, partial [Desulfobacteraceae bacterium]|nr:hypothetical protein [Desulfobacteraceae bacterium]